MGRRRRPYAPGVVFHLVSRTHRHEPWFEPALRPGIARLIQDTTGRTDAELMAYAVMPNHIHVLLRQGYDELKDVMQPLLRRVAYRVQQYHGFEGSVVERQYRDRPCRNVDHVREALVYVHLNPFRAALCGADLAYAWTSHGAYVPHADPTRFGIRPAVQLDALHLFARDGDASRPELCADYLGWIEWGMRRDRARRILDGGVPVPDALRPPDAAVRHPAWGERYTAAVRAGLGQGDDGLPDLRDFLTVQVGRFAPDCSLEDLRGSWLPRRLSGVRRKVIRSALERGFRNGKLALFFNVSASTVSAARYSS
ncbi:MAG: transposase [Gemmatimonadota bacterium]